MKDVEKKTMVNPYSQMKGIRFSPQMIEENVNFVDKLYKGGRTPEDKKSMRIIENQIKKMGNRPTIVIPVNRP
jgi:hypothetical protein